MDLLKTTKVESLLKDQKLVFVPAESSVEDALKVLRESNVSNVPVGASAAGE